jgi:hypothetical protein
MKLETSLARIASLRIGFQVFLPSNVNLCLEIISKELGESLPGV